MSYRVLLRTLCRSSCRRCLPVTQPVSVRCLTSRSILHYTVCALSPSQPQRESTQVSQASTTRLQSSSSCNVDERLVAQLRQLLQGGETAAVANWRSISVLYRSLSPETRRDFVRPHKTLLHVLQKVQAELGIELDKLGTHYRRHCTSNEEEQEEGDTTTTRTQTHNESSNTTSGAKSAKTSSSVSHPRSGLGASDTMSSSCMAVNVFSNYIPIPNAVGPSVKATQSSSNSNNSEDVMAGLKSTMPPVDFYYNVDLRCLPVPPEDFDITPSALHTPRASEDGSVIALRDFVHYIPPFFVPVKEVLAQMPGYTEAHLIKYFTSRVTELVTVGTERYIRLYGGYGEIPLEGCEDAETMYAQYKPDCSLLPAFVKSFAGVYETWMPLELLLERTESAAVAKLPLQGPAAITYFAQMQHVFSFAAEPGTGLKAAVLLRKPGFTGLDTTNSPTPKSCNYVLRHVPADGTLDLHTWQHEGGTTLPKSIMDEITSYFGSLEDFLRAHGGLFYLVPGQALVMRARYHMRMQRASLSLEEQLQLAVKERDKARIRTLRRQIVARDHPDHPLLDPDNLAREVSRYLPEHGHVSQKRFIRTIPEEMLPFMPRNYRRFFANYPQYFQIFEYLKASIWHIAKAGEPLPRGAVRQSFSEHDIVRLVAELLQQMNGGKTACSNLHIHLPLGAQQFVRRRHGNLYYLIEKYPQYFSLVLSTANSDAISQAVVHLIRVPTESSLTGTTTSNNETTQHSSADSHHHTTTQQGTMSDDNMEEEADSGSEEEDDV